MDRGAKGVKAKQRSISATDMSWVLVDTFYLY